MPARHERIRRAAAEVSSITLLLFVVACPSGPTPIPDDIPIIDDSALQIDAEPACVAEVDENGTVTIGARDTGLVFDFDYFGPRVRTWPFVGGSVLVANWPYWEVQGGAYTDGFLYKVVCATATPYELVALDDADFGNAALDDTTATLYFTGPAGVAALDLATLEITDITTAPTFVDVDCWTEQGQRDVVAGLEGRELVIHRGAGCGYEGDWIAREMRLDLEALLSGEDPSPYPSYPVAAVAVDVAGTLWLGNGVRCNEPGVSDPQTHGAIMRSFDRGDTWDVVPIFDAEIGEAMHGAVSQILVDHERPGHVLALAAVCESGAATVGGSAFTTHDSGRTWRRLPVPEDRTTAFDQGQGVLWVGLVDGRLEQIQILIAEDYVGVEGNPWQTTDAGETWHPIAGDLAPTTALAEAAFEHTVWRGTVRGLERHEGGEVSLVYPGDVFLQTAANRFRSRWPDDPLWALESAVPNGFQVILRGEVLTLPTWEDISDWVDSLAEWRALPLIGELQRCEHSCCSFVADPMSDLVFISRICLSDQGGWFAIESLEIP